MTPSMGKLRPKGPKRGKKDLINACENNESRRRKSLPAANPPMSA